ncbi:MAG TPA: hypothetical protein VKX17_15315, partial [Planctomycetota bacterium]|nr:hypothetical protein [Planctomycetota bacterium]
MKIPTLQYAAVMLLAVSFALHAASLTGTKATADAKAEVNLRSLLVAGKSLESPAPSSRPLRHNLALQNALRNLMPSSAVSARGALLPTIGFDALPSNDGPVPPDTNGAIGPNHAMTALNTQIRVQDKAGVLVGTTASLSQFWSQLSLNDIAFDPRLRYDSLAGRWIFTSLADAGSATSAVLIAVSKTDDPTGDWFIYKYLADPAGKNWADFPNVGFNKDWFVLCVTTVARGAGNKFIAMNYFVFDKADLMNGGAGNVTRFSEPYTAQGRERLACPSVCYDSTLAKVYVVESGAGSTLRVSEVAGTLGAETLTTGTATPTSPATYSQVTPSTNLGPQLGATFGIDTNDSLVQNCVFRNGSLWCAQSIFMTSPTRASAQWWQFTPDGTLQQSGLIDDPSAENMYAFPSIAVNNNNDVLIGYSRFSKNAFASSAASFR